MTLLTPNAGTDADADAVADAVHPQEARSGCAAQRVGWRSVLSRHQGPYRRVPLASTCVATVSPLVSAGADPRARRVKPDANARATS
jgi:hypothetical protein